MGTRIIKGLLGNLDSIPLSSLCMSPLEICIFSPENPIPYKPYTL